MSLLPWALAAKLDDATGCKLERAMRAIAADSFNIDGMSECFFNRFRAAVHSYRCDKTYRNRSFQTHRHWVCLTKVNQY